MPERRKPKLEATTAAPAKTPPPLEKDDPVQRVLKVILDEALAGNLTAAKIYLDYSLKRPADTPDALTTEQALELLRKAEGRAE